MNIVRRWYSIVPIHWKLTIWSAALLCLLFAANSVTQFLFVEKWMVRQEEQRVEQEMRELLNILLAKELSFEPENHAVIRNYLERANTRNGMIRILNEAGEPILVAADNMPGEWIHGAQKDPGRANSIYKQDGMLVMQSPITIFQFQGTVEITRSMTDIDRLIDTFYKIMMICCLSAIILSGIGGRLLSRQLIKPLRAMNETMRKVKQNGLQERMPISGAKDDITALNMMFNGMMDQVELSFHQQKQFVEDASHELRTPVAVIEGHLRLLQRWGKNDPVVLESSLSVSLDELNRLKGLVEELLMLSRAEKTGDYESEGCIQPVETLLGIISNVAVVHPDFEIETRLDELKEARLAINERHLEQIVLILLDNAVKYSGESRKLIVAAEVNENAAAISVTDFGIGIAEEDLPHVWNRFYRADKARSGTSSGYGLGLSIAKQLVSGYKGTIQLISSKGQGTTAMLTLPVLEDEGQ